MPVSAGWSWASALYKDKIEGGAPCPSLSYRPADLAGMKSLMAQNQAAFEQKTDEITCKGEDEMRLYWKRRLTTSLSEPYTEGTRVAETTVQWRILV